MKEITWGQWDKLGEMSRDILLRWDSSINKYKLIPVKK